MLLGSHLPLELENIAKDIYECADMTKPLHGSHHQFHGMHQTSISISKVLGRSGNLSTIERSHP
jgi:hypothetical protein